MVIRGQGTPTVCGGQPPGRRARQPEAAWPRLEPCIRSIPMYARPTMWWPHCSAIPTMRPPPRPEPCHKHVWAILPQGPGKANSSIDLLYDWLLGQSLLRNLDSRQPAVHLDAMAKRPSGKPGATTSAGQERRGHPGHFLHVTPRSIVAGGRNYSTVKPHARRWCRSCCPSRDPGTARQGRGVVRGLRRRLRSES